MSAKPTLILLAAGASRRLGEPKALVDLGGRSPLARLMAAGKSVCDDAPLCVAGAHFAEIETAAPSGLEVIEHSHWSAGRTGSIQAAQNARPGRDLLLAPVDVPLVPSVVFEQMLAAWQKEDAPCRGWLAPFVRVQGEIRMGHPILIGRDLATELNQLGPNEPLRFLRANAVPLFRVQVMSERILDDLDTQADLKNLRTHLE
ncbi:MAG: molybdenum cofactor cytidylyltransferase [Planctomycetota bacterium]|jgi:molybdenum cofactor cytidylyltransferase